MSFTNNEKWQALTDPDITKRTPDEWAKIYKVKLTSQISGWWNEYEWAYNFQKLSYIPAQKDSEGFPDWDSVCEKEMRAQYLNRDLFLGADMGEKEILKTKYIETQWIRDNTMRV